MNSLPAPAQPGDSVSAKAPGKINVSLLVGEPEDSGYHKLATLFIAVDLYELVQVEVSRQPGIRVSFSISSSRHMLPEQLPPVHENLAYRAAKALAPLGWLQEFGLEIVIEKHVPVAGGMAGGSADAAATLVACNKIWALGKSRSELEVIGASLGADVPFCLSGSLMLGSGYGDVLVPVLSSVQTWWVLVFSGLQGLSTPEVFATLDAMQAREITDPLAVDEQLLAALATGSLEEMASYMHNDLQVPALHLRPELEMSLEILKQAGAITAIVSGSGPTVVGLAVDQSDAQRIAEQVRYTGREALVVSGPARGAHITHTPRFSSP